MKKRSLYFFKFRVDVSHKTVHGSRFLGVKVFAIECNTKVNHYVLLKSFMILSSTAKPFLAFTVDNEPEPHTT